MAVFGWTIAGPAVGSFCYIWDGIFIGATATAPMRNSMLIAAASVFLLVYALGVAYWDNHAIWLALTTLYGRLRRYADNLCSGRSR